MKLKPARAALLAGLAGMALAACAPDPPAPGAAAPAAALAERIVTLSPHLAELVYLAGAGGRLVGVVEYSDFPPPVRQLPRIGDAFRVDYEAVASLQPDLVLAWTSGNPPETVQRLRNLGFRVVTLEPVLLDDIAEHVERIGELAGTSPAAMAAAAEFRARLARLRDGHRAAVPVRVFVQLATRPYFTVTNRHFLGQGLRLCGGENVFGELPGLTAIVGVESILEARPAAIIASDMGVTARSALAGWEAWPEMPAVRSGAVYVLDADLLSRPSARILDGIAQLCAHLDDARRRLRAPAGGVVGPST